MSKLVVTLTPGEFVQIGPGIKIYNRETHNVKIAIEAPKDVDILRESAKHRRELAQS